MLFHSVTIFGLTFAAAASATTLRGGFLGQRDFRGTTLNAVAGFASAIAPNSCLGDLMMTGYSNDEYGEDDYRYQPSCFNGGESNRLVCFPKSALVKTPHKGTIPMSALQIGDDVLSFNSHRNALQYEKVLFFLHRDNVRESNDWIKVSHAFGSLVLSSTHMVFKEGDNGMMESVAAKRLRQGDTLSFVFRGDVVNSTVSSVTEAGEKTGVYAPVTESGVLFVDGVLSSSYSSLDLFGGFERHAHKLLDIATTPLKFLARRPKLSHSLGKVLSFVNQRSSEEDVMFPVVTTLENAYMFLRRLSH